MIHYKSINLIFHNLNKLDGQDMDYDGIFSNCIESEYAKVTYLYIFHLKPLKQTRYFLKVFDIMSYKQKISYLDQIRPWQKTWLIQAKVVHT